MQRFLPVLLSLFFCAAAGAQSGRVEKSKVGYGTELITAEPSTELLTLAVRIDPQRLFHPVTGWFVEGPGVQAGDWMKKGANFQTHDRHPATADLVLPDGTTVFSGTADFRLFGGMSRLNPQKSFSLSLHEKYGVSQIEYPIFGPDGPREFKYLVARNAGSDWNRAHLRDGLLTDLLEDPSWELDHQATRPARVYINGEYWGLYHLREKINVHYLAERYGVQDKSSIDLLEGRRGLKKGKRRAYDSLLKFIRRNDLSDAAVYTEVRRKLNVDNYQRLQIAQMYFDNQDAGGNLRYWRNREKANARWRWILYDVDQGFGLHSDTAYRRNTLRLLTEANGPAWPNPPWSTLITRKLLESPEYQRSFVNRSLDYLQTDFRPERVVAKIDFHARRIEPEIERHFRRWGGNSRYWPGAVDRLREFARKRPMYLREHLRDFFRAGEDRRVEITAPAGGFVNLNDNINLEGETYRANYFEHFPITVRAVAERGYRFTGWKDGVAEAERLVDLSGEGPVLLQPNFAPAAAPTTTLAKTIASPSPPAGLSDGTNREATPAQRPPGLSTAEIIGRLFVALLVFVVVGLYAAIRRKPE